MASDRRIIVIGAGPAGLTAATALRQAGATVTVLESRGEPGGRSGVDAVHVGGETWRFDRGAEFIASFYGATRTMARRIGMTGADLARLPLDSQVILDGRRHRLPSNPRRLLASRLLSARSKRRVARLGARLAARGPAWHRLADSADLDDQDAASYLARAVGTDYVEHVLPATLDALTLSPAADTSRVVAMAQLAATPRATLYCPNGGLGTLWSRAAGQLPVRYRAEAVTLHLDGDAVVVGTADGEELTADAVLLAGPASLARRLLPADHPDRALAEAALFSPAVKLHLALAEPGQLTLPVCPVGAGRFPLAGIEPLETRDTYQVPDGRGGLEICAAPQLGADLLTEPDRVIRTVLMAEAERLLGGPIGDILGWSVVREPEGVPRFAVGWLRRLRGRAAGAGGRKARRRSRMVDAADVGGNDRIRLAGDWLDSPSIEGAVRSALRASAALLRRTPTGT